jgi:hypothetical protein
LAWLKNISDYGGEGCGNAAKNNFVIQQRAEEGTRLQTDENMKGGKTATLWVPYK